MRRIERALSANLRDLVATSRRYLPHVGAEYIEVAGGMAAFNGHWSPLTTVKGVGSEVSIADLGEIESFFRRHGAGVATIEAAPWLSERSRRLLSRRGYREAGSEDVMAATAGTSSELDPVASSVRVDVLPPEEWSEVMRLSDDEPDGHLAAEMATVASRLSGASLFAVRDGDRWIACGQSVPYGDVAVFGCDATLPAFRGRGAQSAIIAARLAAAPAGTLAVAEVAPGSGSQRNYLRRGFRVAYTRTHYARLLR